MAEALARAALPFLPEDGRGRIINVTSSAGLVGTLGQVDHSAAKAGIVGLTESLAANRPAGTSSSALSPRRPRPR
ncbi:SDR family NAD(P)-dependent oxidoreductase [Streptomyces sp. NBC_01235]|uniref:SDR family NAD(P)-dependent oxidoreductase n=1 Tax=Streptomyces sp. NBC_01235 TaxID=2903788 RepID=UPI002E10E9F9|nr:SDR family NAD(P)-dependent oxidoreductase [Streptomyces sp. NBC_01235]